ncbi:citrate synthase protein [Venturia nashicola]|uniref:Citrate synthase n=1 Tax=Venturia nashicola TaxID=86259 RepID=A0A4Z1P295_9PEZI|nr:citrate synthase protein [Venturia nashicola]
MSTLPAMETKEKFETIVFSTPSYSTSSQNFINSEHQAAASSINQKLAPDVKDCGLLIHSLANTAITNDKARFGFHIAAVKFDCAFLSTSVLSAFAKACSFVGRILREYGGNDKSDDKEGELIVKDSRSGNTYNVPIRKGSVDAMQFRQMVTTSKFSTMLGKPVKGQLKVLDVGYQNTACAESNITFVDGENGKILFRGHNILDLHRDRSFDDVAYLLMWGALPRKDQLAHFREEFARLANPPQNVIDTINGFSRDSPAYLMITAGLSAWAAAVPGQIPVHVGETLYLKNPKMADISMKQGFASFAAIVALIYCHQHGHAFTPAEGHRSLPENVLLMMHFVDKLTGKPAPAMIEELDKLLILYADHEMTASTAALLHTGSVGADALTSLISSVATGWGPLHAGAIDLVYKKLEEIGSVENVEPFIEKVRNKEQRLMGVGHRLYRTQDPRGKLLRDRLLELSLGVEAIPLLAVALEIERVVSIDEYFTSRKLCINADLYGSLVFTALGFEKEIITAVAGIGRCAGALAHWKEAANKDPKIWRPTQLYTGPMSVGQEDGD